MNTKDRNSIEMKKDIEKMEVEELAREVLEALSDTKADEDRMCAMEIQIAQNTALIVKITDEIRFWRQKKESNDKNNQILVQL